jgi:hypothetical protein
VFRRFLIVEIQRDAWLVAVARTKRKVVAQALRDRDRADPQGADLLVSRERCPLPDLAPGEDSVTAEERAARHA